MKIWRRQLALYISMISLLGCRQESQPFMYTKNIGQLNYGTVLVDADSLAHVAGRSILYEYPPTGGRRLIYPSVFVGTFALGNLILFNGRTSNARSDMYYPAFFAYSGRGEVVEITQALAERIGDRTGGITNMSFRVGGVSNDIFSIRGCEKPPFHSNGDVMLFDFNISQTEMLKIVMAAQKNGLNSNYDGVSFKVSRPGNVSHLSNPTPGTNGN